MKGPPVASFFDVDDSFWLGWSGPVARIGGPQINPANEVGDDFVREFARGGHFHSVVFQGLDQAAFGRLPFDECRAGFAAGECSCGGIEKQSPLQLFGLLGFDRVAAVAVLHQHRTNFLLEENDPFVGGGLSEGGGGDRTEQHGKAIELIVTHGQSRAVSSEPR